MTEISFLVLLAGLTFGVNSTPIDDIVVDDFQFSVDPKALQENEMAENIRQISRAVMGTAELVFDIREDLKSVRGDFSGSQRFGRNVQLNDPVSIDDPDRVRKNHELAAKLEKLFGADVDPKIVEKTKEELKKTMEVNFIRVLSAMLVSGPMETQERKEDILRLMRSALNGELDFGPVVENLPFIMRDSETKQFIHLLNTLKENEGKNKKFRQSDNDDDEDGEPEDKPAVQQGLLKAPPAQQTPLKSPGAAALLQQSIIQQAARPQLFQQQVSAFPVQQSQQATYPQSGQPLKQVNIAPEVQRVQTPVAPVAPLAQVAQAQRPAVIQSPYPPTGISQPVVQQPVPIYLQLAQPAPAPTMAPKSGLQKFIEAMNSVNINRLTEFVLKLPELFQGVESLIEGIDFIE